MRDPAGHRLSQTPVMVDLATSDLSIIGAAEL